MGLDIGLSRLIYCHHACAHPWHWLRVWVWQAFARQTRARVAMVGSWESLGACPTRIPPQEKIVFWWFMVF